MVRVGIQALPGEKERAQAGGVVPAKKFAARIFLLDRAERRWRREQHLDVVLGDHAPEAAGVRRPYRLALVNHRRASVQQRRVHDVRMAHCPPEIGGGPEHFARLHAEHGLHRPFQRHGVTTVVPHNALWRAGRARRIEDVERIGGGNRRAAHGRGSGGQCMPIEVAARQAITRPLLPLQDDAMLGRVPRELDRTVEQRLVRDDARALDTTACRKDHPGSRIVDAGRQLGRRKAAEHHGVHGPDARARIHADERLDRHGHVDDDAITLADAECGEHAGECRDLVTQGRIRERAPGARDRTVVDDRELIRSAALDVVVDRVVAGVQLAAGEPRVERRAGIVDDALVRGAPLHGLRRPRPEGGRVRGRLVVHRLVAARLSHAEVWPVPAVNVRAAWGCHSAVGHAPATTNRRGQLLAFQPGYT